MPGMAIVALWSSKAGDSKDPNYEEQFYRVVEIGRPFKTTMEINKQPILIHDTISLLMESVSS
jgi:hypothetical protein